MSVMLRKCRHNGYDTSDCIAVMLYTDNGDRRVFKTWFEFETVLLNSIVVIRNTAQTTVHLACNNYNFNLRWVYYQSIENYDTHLLDIISH